MRLWRRYRPESLRLARWSLRATKLRTEFPHANPELYDRGFATPEELRVAVEASHQSKEKEIAEIRESAEAEIRAELKKKHGIDLAPSSPPPSEGDKSKLTADDVAAMSLSDKMKLTDEQLEALSGGNSLSGCYHPYQCRHRDPGDLGSAASNARSCCETPSGRVSLCRGSGRARVCRSSRPKPEILNKRGDLIHIQTTRGGCLGGRWCDW